MKKLTKRTMSVLLAGVMLMGTISACTPSAEKPTSAPGSSASPSVETRSYPITPDELGSGTVKWAEEKTADGWMKVTNEDGTTLGYSPESGIKLVQKDGYAFKDLNKNGLLDEYEDWRQDNAARAKNLASQLTVEDVAGLMLYSGHQMNLTETVNDEQKAFLDMGLRAVLNAASSAPTELQATWANAMQAYVEGKGLGIPVSFSTDPRSVGVSAWPGNFALASTFDPQIVFEAANQLAKEYRALGISTLLGPQVDTASDPRWSRVNGTYGEDPALVRDMTMAAVNGTQSTYDAAGNDLGWGADSIIAMVKHWPGDAPGESGRESHNSWGKYTVYPGGQFKTHLIPFVDAGFNLTGKTKSAASVMSSYSIAWDEDEAYGELVGSAYSEWKINLLRKTYGFDGVICTDWSVINDGAKTWGVEKLTPGERFYKILMAGVDQLGGHNDPAPILEAYEIGKKDIGEDAILARFQESGDRLVRNYFLVGLFDNPYVSVANAKAVVGSAEAKAAGLAAQQKSVILLKNEGGVISAANATAAKPTVYIPYRWTAPGVSFRGPTPGSWDLPVDLKEANQYFNVVTDTVAVTFTGPADKDGKPTPDYKDLTRASKADLANCEYALVMIKSPNNGGYASGGYDKATNTYVPISLQWKTYTADSSSVPSESLSGDMVEKEVESVYGVQKVQQKENRSYYGQSFTPSNSTDLDAIFYARENMPKSAKIVVAVNADNAFVPAEFESQADVIMTGFGVNNKLFMGALAGEFEPTGLLPVQIPASMDAVEAQKEDVPRDMTCYTDAAGNTYDFAYGLNWSGVIKDARTEKYNVPPLTEPANQGN